MSNPDDDRREFLDLLEGGVRNIFVTYNDYRVTPGDFYAIARLLRQGHIRIVIDATTSVARYDPAGKIFQLQAAASSSVLLRAQCVHEACHAISDLKKKEIWLPSEEAVAYVAQFMYKKTYADPVNPHADDKDRSIATAASRIADSLMNAASPAPEWWTDLERAVAAHPKYHDKTRNRKFGGF